MEPPLDGLWTDSRSKKPRGHPGASHLLLPQVESLTSWQKESGWLAPVRCPPLLQLAKARSEEEAGSTLERGLRVASSWRMGRCGRLPSVTPPLRRSWLHFSREQGSVSLHSTFTEVLIDESWAPSATKTGESTNHSNTGAWGESGYGETHRCQLRILISSSSQGRLAWSQPAQACVDRKCRKVSSSAPQVPTEGVRFIRNSRAGFY